MKSYLLSRRMLANLLVLGFLGVWFVTLAPTAIHGPAAYIEVSGHSMDGTYKTGDLILTRKQDSYAAGDIITFKVPAGSGEGQVIHRIVSGNGATGYTTQGDNNPDADPWHPTDADIVGQAWHRFEGKAWLLHLPKRPWFAGVTAGLLTLIVLGIDAIPRGRGSKGEVTLDGEATELVGAGPATTPPDDVRPKIPAQRTTSDVPAPVNGEREAARQASRDGAPTVRVGRTVRSAAAAGKATSPRWRRR